MTSTIELAPRLDTAFASTLQATLSSNLGGDVSLDGTRVEHLGARCLELLLRCQAVLESQGHGVSLLSPSDALVRDLATFGLTPNDISTGGTT